MCGICFAMSKKGLPVRDIIRGQYQCQKSRGTDGFGYLAFDKKARVERAVKEKTILKRLGRDDSTAILFHHRFPTSTDNVINATHPFEVDGIKTGKKYYLVHNGIITNDDKLRLDHLKRGIKYKSMQDDGRYNDSEALAVEMMLCLEGAKRYGSFKASGSIALICLECDAKGNALKLHFARNSGSPLSIRRTNRTIQIASELDGMQIPTDKLITQDINTGKVSERAFVMPYSYYTYNYSYDKDWYKDERDEFSEIVGYEKYANRDYFRHPDYKKGFDDGYWYSEDMGISYQYSKDFIKEAYEEYQKSKLLTDWNEYLYWLGYRDGLGMLEIEESYWEDDKKEQTKLLQTLEA